MAHKTENSVKNKRNFFTIFLLLKGLVVTPFKPRKKRDKFSRLGNLEKRAKSTKGILFELIVRMRLSIL